MSPNFNPYHTWLDIAATISRPNYYQLLKIDEFEPDTRNVIVAADRALARVRGFKPGDRAAAWSNLLDELAQARACLADKAKKQAYDRALKERLAQPAEEPDQNADAPLEVAPVNTTPDLYPPGMAPADSTPKSVKKKFAAKKPSPKTSAAAPAAAKRPTSAASSTNAPRKVPQNKAVTKKTGVRQSAVPKTAATTGPDSVKKANRPQAANRPKTRSSKDTKTGPMAVAKDHAPRAKPTARSAIVNAHVAPPQEPKRSTIPMVLGIVAVLGLLTLGMLYLAIGSSW